MSIEITVGGELPEAVWVIDVAARRSCGPAARFGLLLPRPFEHRQNLDVSKVRRPARLFRTDEIGSSQIRHSNTVDPAHHAIGPGLLKRDGARDGEEIDARHVADDRERTGGDLLGVEFAADANGQFSEGVQDALGIGDVSRNQEIHVFGRPHRSVQIGGHPTGDQVSSPMPIQQPADDEDAVIGARGWSGHDATVRSRPTKQMTARTASVEDRV